MAVSRQGQIRKITWPGRSLTDEQERHHIHKRRSDRQPQWLNNLILLIQFQGSKQTRATDYSQFQQQRKVSRRSGSMLLSRPTMSCFRIRSDHPEGQGNSFCETPQSRKIRYHCPNSMPKQPIPHFLPVGLFHLVL